MLDENEFLGPFGIRSLSRYHREHPYVFHVGGQEYRVDYLPAESNTGMFGGNSNWRGPIWMPVNVLLIRGSAAALLVSTATIQGRVPHRLRADDEPVRGRQGDRRRLTGIFLRDETGRRPVYRRREKFQDRPALARSDPLL